MIKRTVLLAALLTLPAAHAAAASDDEKCLAGRASAKGKYELCVQKWLARYYGGSSIDNVMLAKCRIKYAAAWARLQTLDESTTCTQPRFVDNGDGTVSDNFTGLTWEKKSDDGGPHDKDTTHTWTAGAPYWGSGTAFQVFLATDLNAAGFAGANDWRLPTFAELQTILLPEPYPCTTTPCVDAVFNTACNPGCSNTVCSCTTAGPAGSYWTSTTHPGGAVADNAWDVYFGDGFGLFDNKVNSNNFVRAVRGGL